MKVVSLNEYTDNEINMLNTVAMGHVSVYILEHEKRRLYLVFDQMWKDGGHPAVYTSLEEMAADKYGQ